MDKINPIAEAEHALSSYLDARSHEARLRELLKVSMRSRHKLYKRYLQTYDFLARNPTTQATAKALRLKLQGLT